jgi:CRP/FNR family transcriptional regulator, anaerobic regulatory protein
MYDELKKFCLQLVPAMNEEALNIIVEKSQVMHYSKGQDIVADNAVCNYVYFINKGFVRFYVKAEDKEICTGFIGAGTFVSAYQSFLTRQPNIDCLGVIEDVELLAISYNDIQSLYKTYPITEILGRKVAESLFIMINQRTNALLVLTPEERYLKMIETQPEIMQNVPQYMLATYIGVTPEHLSRLRKKMAAKK